jgi:voltage-gated potassium channel
MVHLVFIVMAVVLFVLVVSGDFWDLVKSQQYRRLLVATVFTIGLGSAYYSFAEGWSLVDSFYFSVISLLTVGYGDFVPTTPFTKMFTVFYLILGASLLLSFINALAQQHFLNDRKRIKALLHDPRSNSDDS